MELVDIALDGALWEAATDARRDEWRVAMAELVEDHSFAAEGRGIVLRIAVDGATTSLSFVRPDGETLADVEIAPDAMRAHVAEYLGICRQIMALDQASCSPRLEALDMAKKLAHDDAARTLAELVEVRPDHPTSRRLFTLLLTLHVDTTKLHVVHLHARR